MAKDKVFQITCKEGDALRVYEVGAKDETAAQELVREQEARQDQPLKITKTTEV